MPRMAIATLTLAVASSSTVHGLALGASLPRLNMRAHSTFEDFCPITSIEDYEKCIGEAAQDDITIIKWVSEGCRTCRAAGPKIKSVVKRWSQDAIGHRTSFYAVELKKNYRDEALQQRWLDFCREREVKQLPYVELYLGGEQVQGLVVPPSRVSFLRVALAEAKDSVRARRRRRARRNLLLTLRAAARARRLERGGMRSCANGAGCASEARWTTPRRSNADSRRRYLTELRGVGAARRRAVAEARGPSGGGGSSTSLSSGGMHEAAPRTPRRTAE